MRGAFISLLAVMYFQSTTVLFAKQESNEAKEDEIGDCQRKVENLKNDVLGLEFFLKDKKDYKKHCPSTKWDQPELEEYKKEPKSYLPDKCKSEEIVNE